MLTLMLLGAVVSGPELQHCRLERVLFLSPTDGYVFDACGKTFETRDGGASWVEGKSLFSEGRGFGRSISEGALLSDGTVLVGGFIGASVLRSTDQGRSFQPTSLPSDQMVYAFSHAGPDVWLCGSSGQVVHSADSAASWKAAASSPTNSDDRCISLSFLDGARGWVAGWYGHLFETSDGGATWKPLPLPPEFKVEGVHPRTIDAVLRLSAKVGFVAGAPGTYRTVDGGKTWTRLELRDDSKLIPVSLAEGRRLMVTERSAKAGPEGWEPRLDLRATARGADTVVLQGEQLASYGAAGARRVGRLTGAAGKEAPRAETMRTFGEVSSGFDRKRAFRSDDGRQTWVELAPLPGEQAFETVAFISTRTVLARAVGGALFRSDDEGGDWRASEPTSLDAFDLARATGVKVAAPLKCLRATEGTATLDFGARGCFGGNTNVMKVEWGPRGAVVTTTLDAKREERRIAPLRLAPAEAKARLAELAELSERPEVPSGCRSTTGYVVTLSLACAPGRTEVVHFESHDCNPHEGLALGVGGATSSGTPGGYARALGLHGWANGLLEQATAPK